MALMGFLILLALKLTHTYESKLNLYQPLAIAMATVVIPAMLPFKLDSPL